METKLKPCPFCGGQAKFVSGTITIKCKSCGGAFICINPTITAKEVADAWNRRAYENERTYCISMENLATHKPNHETEFCNLEEEDSL